MINRKNVIALNCLLWTVIFGSLRVEAAAFQGYAPGSFINPTPSSAFVGGVGTNILSWGIPRSDASSYLVYQDGLFEGDINKPFPIGRLDFVNHETKIGTSIKSVDLNIIFSLVGEGVVKEINQTMYVGTTRNVGDPNLSSDTLTLKRTTGVFAFEKNGEVYTVIILGFGGIDINGADNIYEKVIVKENESVTLVLWCKIIKGPLVVGLGDSVAAGYGLGGDGNIASYSMKIESFWGKKRGYSSINLARSGAVSGNCAKSCYLHCSNYFPMNKCINECLNGSQNSDTEPCKSVTENQLSDAVKMNPKIVALTVGANDIGFDECLDKWLKGEFGGVISDFTGNPCWPGSISLEERLKLLHENLEIIFKTLDKSEVFVTTYYNPFPSDQSSLCKQFYLPVAANITYSKNWRLASLNELKAIAKEIQKSTYSFANTVVINLNKIIIETAAQYPNVHVVPLNFERHDFCRSISQAWVYGTQIDAWFWYLKRGLPVKWEYYNAMPMDCLFPRESDIIPFYEKNIFGLFGLSLSVNCLPHPTGRGENAIAKAVIKEIRRARIR